MPSLITYTISAHFDIIRNELSVAVVTLNYLHHTVFDQSWGKVGHLFDLDNGVHDANTKISQGRPDLS